MSVEDMVVCSGLQWALNVLLNKVTDVILARQQGFSEALSGGMMWCLWWQVGCGWKVTGSWETGPWSPSLSGTDAVDRDWSAPTCRLAMGLGDPVGNRF